MEPSPPPQPVAPLSYRPAQALAEAPDNCYRCGYPLLGIDDEQACPECGLLARRSRRTTDELHNTRPRWLARISRGANLILLAVIISVVWPMLMAPGLFDYYRLMYGSGFRAATPWVGLSIGSALLFIGAWMLTSREGYPPADRADRPLRTLVRVAAAMPILAILLVAMRRIVWMGLLVFGIRSSELRKAMEFTSWAIVIVGLPPLPMLLFLQLRGLAKRARSAHLAEHCLIVGVGTSSALVLFVAYGIVVANARYLRLGTYWTSRSQIALLIMLTLAVGTVLFALWSLYLFIRFARAFRRAAMELNAHWTRDDRSLEDVANRADVAR